LTAALTIGFGFVACDSKKKLDGMASTTEEMNQTTKDMAKDTEEVNDQTKEVLNKSSSIDEKTQLVLTGEREAKMEDIQTKQMDLMIHSSDPEVKVNSAIIYFGVMEFQKWYPSFEDQAKREMLYMKAVDLFFSKIAPFLEDEMLITNDKPSSRWMNLASLAVAMSRIHPEQVAEAKAKNYVAMSFYDILKAGLEAKSAYLAGEKISDYKLHVLENERTVLYLLQLRHNFFKALILARITNFEDQAPLGKWMMLTFGWDADLGTFPDAELKLMNEWMWKSFETQHYLQTIHVPVVQSESFAKVFRAGHIAYTAPIAAPPLRLETTGNIVTLEEVRAEPSQQMFTLLLSTILGESGPALRLKP
jgi:hypothetical protein